MTELAPKRRLQRWEWNFSPTWLRISGLFTEYHSESDFPKEARPNQDVTEVQSTDPYTQGALKQPRLHVAPVLPLCAHTRAVPVILKLVYLDFICIYILEGVTHFFRRPSSLSRGFSSPMEGSRRPAGFPPLLNSPLCYTCHIFTACCSLKWNQPFNTAPGAYPKRWKGHRRKLGPTVCTSATCVPSQPDRGSKEAKMFENCLITATICT